MCLSGLSQVGVFHVGSQSQMRRQLQINESETVEHGGNVVLIPQPSPSLSNDAQQPAFSVPSSTPVRGM